MVLNHAQKEAVIHDQGACLVLAGPGSGKTFTIAQRIAYLIREKGVRPEEILVVTFTRDAAREMENRFRKAMGGREYPVTFGTFHAVFYRILLFSHRLDAGRMLTAKEKREFLCQAARQADPAGEKFSLSPQEISDLEEEIAAVKNQGSDPDAYRSARHDPQRFRRLLKDYEERKKREGKFDFEDMLSGCEALFTECPETLRQWQERFRYILIDEFQDINPVQYRVIRMLAAPENNLFAVGDDDQSIYRFRGARPEIMREFLRDYPGAKQILLNINYRSTAYLVHGAQRVIGYNQNRFQKEILSQQGTEYTVHVQEVQDKNAESRYVYRRIKEQLSEGIRPEEIAVLYRTARDAHCLTEILTEYRVPFAMREKPVDMYSHFTAQDMMSYLRIAAHGTDRRDFLRVANRPGRGIGRDSMAEKTVTFEELNRFYDGLPWMQARIRRFETDMRTIDGKTPYAAITYLRKKTGYDEFLREYASLRALDPDELLGQLDEIQKRSAGFQTTREWFAHIDSYREALWRASRTRPERGQGRVQLMTMHGAKGLEFDSVFMIGANEGVTPYRRAVLDTQLEEERRLFYVAMTRARHRLDIVYCREKNGKKLLPSRFICELTGSQIGQNAV